MMNSSYPFNTVSASIPETINAIRTELEDEIKETILKNIGSNISQRELESLMNSFSPIIQKQVLKYVREFNHLNHSINSATNNCQYYQNSIQFNGYSSMSNNFMQNSQYVDIDSCINSSIWL